MTDKIFIIGEAGVNHNGSIATAKKMIDAAVSAGVDAVKFQSYKTEELAGKSSPAAEYQKKASGSRESQYKLLKRLELGEKEQYELFRYCRRKNILFLSTPFDIKSVDFLNKLGLGIFKIPSGEITNYLILEKIGSLKKKVILSTGMSDMKEIAQALEVLINAGTPKSDITVLQCNTEYPTPFEDVNLSAMLTIKKYFDLQVGYSDHTLGIEIPVAAAALGAAVIEKHFTLDKNMFGPDHKASALPRELEDMVRAVRNVEKALGDGVKKPSPSELKNLTAARKSIVARCGIKAGAFFNGKNITAKRPGNGLSPMMWPEVLNKKATKDFKKDDLIEL